VRYCNVKELIMPWQTFPHCPCCQGCVHLDGGTCRLHGRTKRLCNGACPDRMPEEPDLSVLTDDNGRGAWDLPLFGVRGL
jgi:hypothetical protein